MSERRPMAANLLSKVASPWRQFWFTPQPNSTLTVFRIALGFLVLCWALSLGPDLSAFFSESGVMPEPSYARYRIGVFLWFESDVAIAIMYIILVACTWAVMTGRVFRPAAILMWLGVASFQYDNILLLNSGDMLLRILCAYLALYALLTPTQFAGMRLGRLFSRDEPPTFEKAPFWLVRLVQIQLTVIYPFSVVAKLKGDTWLNGTAAGRATQLLEFQRFPVPDFVQDSVLINGALTYGVIALEFALPFLLWTRRTRLVGVILGVSLHLGMNYALRVGFFSWIMVCAYLCFLTPKECSVFLTKLHGWILRAKRGIGGRAGPGRPAKEAAS